MESFGPNDPGHDYFNGSTEPDFELFSFQERGWREDPGVVPIDPTEEAAAWIMDYLSERSLNKYLDNRGSYEIFTDAQERRELYLVGRRLSEYVVNEGVAAVFFMDRSARPAYVAMKEFWRYQYPDIPMPYIGFFNPKGFVSREDVASGEVDIMELAYNDQYKQGEIESLANIRPTSEIVSEIKNEVGEDYRGKPILVFDACIHTGNSIAPVLDKLDRAGLTNTRFGVVSPRNNRSGIEPDFTVMDKVPVGVCYPFDKDGLTKKTYTSIHSESNVAGVSMTEVALLRNEIRRAVREFASSPN